MKKGKFMKFKNKNVLVYGMSSSGEWATKLLLKKKAFVFLYDDDVEKLKNKKFKDCYLVSKINENFISQFDYIVLSPSIELDNFVVKVANKHKIKIFSELELASLFCKNFVAITGTNGKTTTVQLATALINTKQKAVACGNIGYPLSRAVLENKRAIKVVEVSSFMLEHCQDFCPKASTILNIEPDHLIRHKTMEEYAKCKYQIFKNLSTQNYAIINLDLPIRPPKQTLEITYSQTRSADVYLKNGAIYLHNNKIINLNELHLSGKHNIYNIMCAICFASIYKVNPQKMHSVLANFVGDNFRIQHVATINNINFYNDSKSTNIASTLASVDAVKGSIILMLGGSFKGLDYKKLFAKLNKRVKQIFAFGEIADDLISANENKFKIEKCADLFSAFDSAVKIALPEDNILLSPASASYDQFKNYIERGEAFNKKVRDYELETRG